MNLLLNPLDTLKVRWQISSVADGAAAGGLRAFLPKVNKPTLTTTGPPAMILGHERGAITAILSRREGSD